MARATNALTAVQYSAVPNFIAEIRPARAGGPGGGPHMLKIVDVHLSERSDAEYVVLQNQGLTTLSLRGWALCSDVFLEGDPEASAETTFIFSEDVPIKPYTRIVLFTGEGEDGWCP